MNKKITFLLGVCFSMQLTAQEYKWQSAIDTIATDGFYKIQLPPAITSKLKSDFSDIRILNAAKKEVPYLTKTEHATAYNVLFKEYKITELVRAGKHTKLILQNPSKNKIDNVQLVIKNADVTKTLRLSGSDDNKQWYVISDNYMISDVYSHTETSIVKIFNFPLSDYEFLKIDISDSLSPPLNILKAGYYDTYSENAKYSEVLKPVITQKDCTENKTSCVRISFPESQLLDKINFEIEGPHYFLRNCQLGTLEERTYKNRKPEKIFNPIADLTVSSNGNNSIYVDNYKTKELYLFIYNNDNLPLKIKSAQAFQVNHSLIAYLSKNEACTLVFGNEKAASPVYDLINFKDSISALAFISPREIKMYADQQAGAEKSERSLWQNKFFIWTALALVLLVLGFMSVKMIREAGKK